ncbi:MAG: hypothetical protein UW26_C0027G0009 [Candidatus Collierbacteria bacterium GW2011_GWF1_44_12]|uniref:DNA polymerase III delta subunit-like C-terminal domain-containing protein n=1 Tax=Candidatus Collierbacteria bacterium GW2011_GWF1_44_12 TaxID=1618402 RepID=A0A0G1GTW0_9BACT|nr:MAG: hypothetical protein UW26_C0027G0009 [Candidatus Collierbacteria bacterium GW2011_GWF1_44_12]
MIIIHGENTKGSYSRLNLLIENHRKEGKNIISYNAAEIDITRLEQELNPSDLFGNQSLLVISNLFSGPKSKQKEALKISLQEKVDQPVVLYEQKEVPPTSLKPFTGSQIEVFKVSPQIFKFLESLSPNSPLLAQFNSLLSQEAEVEFIYAMLVRQIRLLITAKTNPNQLKTAPFVKRLLIIQAGKFSLEHLLDLHHRLYLIDKQIKLGKTSLDMESLLTGFLTAL